MHVRGYDLVVEESANPINSKTRILLSRNHPIAIIVGAAGFLGSHLVERLLKLGVQVVGVDSLETGRKENLKEAFKQKGFHFITSPVEDSNLRDSLAQLPRLDYAFFAAENQTSSALYKLGLENFLQIVLDHKIKDEKRHERPKIVFISSIEMYDSKDESLSFLKQAEETFAKFSRHHKLNARIIRLSEVYGPRMHFREPGSFSRLIKASLEQKLVSEQTALEFSCRGMFIEDAIALIVKSSLSGSTAGKIYDGCLPHPVKVTEIKQILLDPLWYKHRGFAVEKLPPWPTPNLEKTIKELSWKPKTELVEALKKTMDFFNDDEQARAFALNSQSSEVKEEKKLKVPGWSFHGSQNEESQSTFLKQQKNKGFSVVALIWMLIIFGLIFPLANFLVGSYLLPLNLVAAKQSFERGEIEQTKRQIVFAQINLTQLKGVEAFLTLVTSNQTGSTSLDATAKYIFGQDALVKGVSQVVEGVEKGDSSAFAKAEGNLSVSLAQLSDPQVAKLILVPNLKMALDPSLGGYFYGIAQKGRVTGSLLPLLFPQTENKSYLIFLEDNKILKPNGGVITTFAKVDVEKGSLKQVESFPITDLKNQASAAGLIVNLESNNAAADFPTFGQYLANLYQKLNGQAVDGVFLMDTHTFNQISQVLNGQPLSADNPASLKNLLQSLNPQNKHEDLKLSGVINEALDQKHLMLFSTNLSALSLIKSQGWAGSITPSKEPEQGTEDFLLVLDTNTKNIPTTLKKNLNLQTQINEDGGVGQKLNLALNNSSFQLYSSHLQFFLPLGTRLTGAKFNNQEISPRFTSTVDFGWAVYNIDLDFGPNSTSNLEINYILSGKVGEQAEGEVKNSNASYSLKVLKQPGTSGDHFTWNLSLADRWKEISSGSGADMILLKDQKFDISLRKP